MEQLIEQAKNGDKLAEQEIFSKLLVRFRYFAKRIIGERDCDDLAQEACMTILKKYKVESYSVSFTAWAFGVLKMKIGNYLQTARRRADREIELDNNVGSGLSESVNPDLKRHLVECLAELARSFPRYARIVNLCYHGFATREVCEKLEINPNHFYVSLNRGRSLLKGCLDKRRVLQ